jgi:pimeloyl-ACP methyl ester carboxylesterase
MHAISLVFWLSLCSTLVAAQEPRKAGDVVIEQASLTTTESGTVQFELGTIYVPENRSEPTSRLIGVGFARFRSLQPSQAPPQFLLPGGPANSYLAELKNGSARMPGMLKRITGHCAVSDVVLLDQRGFSERGEVLKHKYRVPDEPLDQPGSVARASVSYAEMARGAVAEFAARGVDLRGYTVIECADDVNELRKALGYERVTLVGGSFGSQWSFAVLQRHPSIVARALLAGVEPLDCGYDMPSHVMAAVHRMWWEAEKNPRLAPYLPAGGLIAAARDVLRRLEREPVRLQLKGVKDAATGQPPTVVLGHEDFQQAFLRGADGPSFVLSAYHGHYDAWAFSVAMSRRSRTIEVPMIAPLIDSSLGVTPRRLYLLRSDPATAFLGHWNFDRYLSTADIWPTADVGDEFRTETVCHVPVVFVHGDWDIQTPVENTLQIAPYFPNGHVLLVERGGHGAMNQVAQELPETMDSLLGFLKTGSIENLPARVTLPAPSFNVPSFPAPEPK